MSALAFNAFVIRLAKTWPGGTLDVVIRLQFKLRLTFKESFHDNHSIGQWSR